MWTGRGGVGLSRWQPRPWTRTRCASRATSAPRRQPHPQICSCFLELFTQIFGLPVYRTRLMGPCSCQRHAATLTRATRQRGRTSFPQAQIWSVGITTMCPDNPATHTQRNSPGLTNHTWEFSCHLHKPPKWPLCSLPTHPPHSSNFPVSPSLGAQCREHGPSVTIPRSRHMTITVHLPLTATSHIQPKSDSIPAPGCLPTETSHSQETLHLQPSRILLPKHLNYQIHPQCTVVHTGLGNK